MKRAIATPLGKPTQHVELTTAQVNQRNADIVQGKSNPGQSRSLFAADITDEIAGIEAAADWATAKPQIVAALRKLNRRA